MYRLLYREKHISPSQIIYGARLFLSANIWISLNGFAFVTKVQAFILILQYYLDIIKWLRFCNKSSAFYTDFTILSGYYSRYDGY